MRLLSLLSPWHAWTVAVKRGLATPGEMARWQRGMALESAMNEMRFWRAYRYVMEAK